MKFVSKTANYMAVLRQGLPGNVQLGTPMTSGLYARFKDGVLEAEGEMAELLKKHPACGSDFVAVEDLAQDPYANQRISPEPQHVISEMKYGHMERLNKPTPAMTPEMKSMLMDLAKPMAIELAKQMLPSMIKETIQGMAVAQAAPEAAVESEIVEETKKVKTKK